MASKTTKQTKSTQDSLLISEIKDGIVVLRDGSLRAVVLARAINYDLMSQQEQGGIELAYQGFLNSLHFPIQIAIKSHKIDLDNYLEKLETLRASQDNALLGALMDDYVANIRGLLEDVNIMDKKFYVVLPLFPPVVSRAGAASRIKGIFSSGPEVVTIGAAEFEQHKTELTQRVQLVASGLTQMGVWAIPLNTQELVELYYESYNPDVAANQKLIDASDMQTAAVVAKGEVRNAPAPAPTPAPAPAPTPPPAPEPRPAGPASPTPPTGQAGAPANPFVDTLSQQIGAPPPNSEDKK